MIRMIRYTVTAVIQSANIDKGQPVDVKWYTGTNLGKALAALTGAAAHDEDVDHGDLPESVRYRTLSVRLDKEVLPDEERGGITYDVTWPELPEAEAYALSDCAWWDNQYQPWSRVECSGRMALVSMLNGGHLVTSAVLCEAHVNAYPEVGLG